MKRGLFLAGFCLAAASPDVWAYTNYTPSDLSGLDNDSVKSLIETVSIGGDHHAYMPATPLGVLLGLDIGVEVTVINIPSSFQTALSLASQQPASNIPNMVPAPKLSVHKGLPGGIDIGGSFFVLKDSNQQNLFESIGGDVKWAFLRGGPGPTFAARFSGSYNSLYFMNSRTYSLDVLMSKSLVVMDPYAGFGMQFWSGDLSFPSTIPQLPSGVSSHQSGTSPRIFLGTPIKLAVLRITGQFDYSFSGITTYGAKISFCF